MDPFIGEIRQFPFTFAPRGWAFCNGQLLAVQANSALFAILGTSYGGNGTTNFALPNLMGRVVTGADAQQSWGPGAVQGDNAVTLSTAQIPQHSHLLTGQNIAGSQVTPNSDSYLAFDSRGGAGVIRYMRSNGTPSVAMAASMLEQAGSSQPQPHENRQPFLALNFCIALEGVFPTRN